MVQNERFLRGITADAAVVVTILGGALLLLAVIAELRRRRTGHSRFVLLADRLLPTAARRTAVALLTVLSAVTTFIGPQTASADTSVRDWLTDTTTPTSQPATESTPTTVPQFPKDRSTSAERTPAAPPSGGPAHSAAAPATTPPSPPSSPAPAAPRTAPVVHGPNVTAPGRADQPPHETQPIPAARNATPSTPPPTAVAGPAVAMYQVVPGDCLWSIAARALGGAASSSAIDRGWRAIYTANRAAIGDNPSLIHPGLVLTLPSLSATP